MQGLIIFFDLVMLGSDHCISQIDFLGIFLSELDILSHVFILQQLLTFTEVICPSSH